MRCQLLLAAVTVVSASPAVAQELPIQRQWNLFDTFGREGHDGKFDATVLSDFEGNFMPGSLIEGEQHEQQPGSPATLSAMEDVEAYLLGDTDPTKPTQWAFTSGQMAEAMIAISPDPRLLRDRQAAAKFADLVDHRVDELSEKQRVTSVMVPLLNKASAESLPHFAGAIGRAGGEPALTLGRQVADGVIEVKPKTMLVAFRRAGLERRFDKAQLAEAKSLTRRLGNDSPSDKLYTLFYLDRDAFASDLLAENWLAVDAPEREAATEITLSRGLAVDSTYLARHLDATGLDKGRHAYLRDLLLLMSRVDRAELQSRADAIDAAGQDASRDADERRTWQVLSTQLKLEMAGVNVDVTLQVRLGLAAEVPAAALTIHRVYELHRDLRGGDAELYKQRRTAADMSVDVAALRAIGAEESAKRLQRAIDTNFNAPPSDPGNWPDDLLPLVLQYQLDQQASLRPWIETLAAEAVLPRTSTSTYEAAFGR